MGQMTLELALFAILATAVGVSAVGVAASRTVVRSAVWLLFTLIGVAFVYFLLGAAFLGAAQLIVYVGGTLVLVVFGGMLTAGGPFEAFRTRRAEWLLGLLVAGGLFALLASVSLQLGGALPTSDGPAELPGPGPLGLAFLGVPEGRQPAYLLVFEIVSVHLLVILIGAAYLARPTKRVPPTP